MMKIAFSTLSCPTWTIDQIIRATTEYGYDGVELRGIGDNVDLREVPELAPSARAATRARFENSGLALCCLDSSARFANPEHRQPGKEELKGYIELAAELGSPLVRVFGGSIPEGADRMETAHAIADTLNEVAPFAREHGVAIGLETHDAFTTGAQLAPIMAGVESDVIGVVWDIYNAYADGEDPAEAYQLLRPYIRHVHIKDGQGESYTLLGEGTTPIREMVQLLGTEERKSPLFLSVEWEKRWIPGLAEPEVVLPQYASVLRSYL